MKALARSLVVVLVALISVPALVVSTAITSAVQLLATTALIMGGTQHPLSTAENDFAEGYMAQVVQNYLNPAATETAGTPQQTNGPVTRTVAVVYPAEFFPVFGTTTFDQSVDEGRKNLHSCLDASDDCDYNGDVSDAPNPGPGDDFVVFGYSQSAVIASLVKRDLITNPGESTAAPTSFVLAANPMRPNGGILGRGFEGMTIPIIGITFYGPTPTNSARDDNGTPDDPTDDTYQYPTVDVAQQYDFLGGDAPARPLNVLAMANSIAAYAQLHGNVPSHSITEPGVIDQGVYGDTHYYMIPADRLPILMPLHTLGVPSAALALPDAILRVWIEDAYARDKSPGEHVQFQIIPIGNPVALIGNTLGAVPVGLDDTVQQATGTDTRPLGTANVYRPFGVGGPVYDKTDGTLAKDNVGIPTGSGSYGDTSVNPQQTQPLQTNSSDAAKVTNTQPTLAADNSGTTTTPKAVRPKPLQEFRDSVNNFVPKPPSQPTNRRPLSGLLDKLKPQKDTKTGADTTPAKTGDAA
ncbi:PE-PPE domain-containing protein [Mycobacterium sp. 1274761.0]|uniref:PE-PPE domain-containing protein n=1 Tax=Mycobacterium sp. 1274761.0 TaxID=1834077 RepID=UPI0007FBE11E|nr:PE-PPE domain-containing protein [Mycobacterium sp. 1274761.0]OBK80065.1 hypothetical protein A5651_01195 [Mycobacterium sp. 1274761.0]